VAFLFDAEKSVQLLLLMRLLFSLLLTLFASVVFSEKRSFITALNLPSDAMYTSNAVSH